MIARVGSLFAFQRNAQLYLLSVSVSSLAQGAFGVIQGLYILSLGFDEAVLGTILSVRMLAAAIASVPAGALSDRLGRKPVLVAGGFLTTAGYLGMALASSSAAMLLWSCIVGISQACQMTSGAPLLAESSTREDRARLFGVNFSLSMSANMAGSLLGGFLPGRFRTLDRTGAFRFSLALFSAVTLLGVLPALRIREIRHREEPREEGTGAVLSELGSFRTMLRNRDVMGLLTYSMLIGFGAGLVVPFFNVFLSGKLGVDTGVIGLILSLTNGATALAGLLAPVLAEKYGKVKTVVATQMASIPFLLLIALPPNVYLVSAALFLRSALMNMSNPVASSFSMEIVEPDKRGKVSSLMRISDNVSRALSAAAAGYIMSRWDYEIPYFFTAALYLLATLVYWRAFRGRG